MRRYLPGGVDRWTQGPTENGTMPPPALWPRTHGLACVYRVATGVHCVRAACIWPFHARPRALGFVLNAACFVLCSTTGGIYVLKTFTVPRTESTCHRAFVYTAFFSMKTKAHQGSPGHALLTASPFFTLPRHHSRALDSRPLVGRT